MLERKIRYAGPFNVEVKTHEYAPGIIQQRFTVLGQTWIITTHRDGEVIEYDLYEDGKLLYSEVIRE